MSDSVWGFFYGGLISPEVMQRVGFTPQQEALAWLPGFDLRIAPLVNLVSSPGASVFGLLLQTTHAQLDHVYGQLKATYVPFPVVAHEMDGRLIPALCYIVPDMAPAQAEASHIQPLLAAGVKLGFPPWYLAKIRSFLPSGVS
jgi:Gamma-glutamyl cyclotransferase, AIG2-like